MNHPNRLPDPVARYIQAQNEEDTDAMVASFTPDAVVHDERREHRGTSAVREWIVDVTKRYAPKIRVVETSTDGADVIADVLVSGTFPGSPLRQRFVFALTGERIARLEIA